MRQFKLINSTGAVFDLMRTDAFLWEPDGLGWGYDTGVADMGEAYIPTETTITRPAPSGTMVFAGYTQYTEFLTFIQAGGLVLGYQPLSTDAWRYLDVSAIIGKNEIKPETGRLLCDISFNGLSHWYETPITYAADNGRADIVNGALSSFCKISIAGAAVDPTWTLYDSTNAVISSGKVTATIPAGDTLIINSRPRSMEIMQYDSNGDPVGSVYPYSDFTTARFITIPPGTGYYILFSDDGGAMGACSVEVYKRV